MTYSVLCNRYRGSVKLSQELVWRDDKQLSNLISVSCHSDIKQNGKKDTKITAHINQSVPDASLSVCLARESGDEKPYVFMPSALYDGNRFHCAAKPYPPMLTKEERSDFAHQPVISDVPRLTRDEQSFVQLSTGDMATPCVGYFSARDKVGYLLFFPKVTVWGILASTIRKRLMVK